MAEKLKMEVHSLEMNEISQSYFRVTDSSVYIVTWLLLFCAYFGDISTGFHVHWMYIILLNNFSQMINFRLIRLLSA